MITAERLDPLLTATGSDYDREALRLHLERYEYAAARVEDKRVVDCACGTGYGSATLARAGATTVVGVDIDDAAVAYARRHHAHERVTYVVGDATTYMPPFLPEVWVTLETVEHLADPEAYLRAAWSRLAPDALLIASVPTTVSTDGNPFHRTDFTRKRWHRLLAVTGFVAEDELVQTHRYSLKQIFGSERGERQRQMRRNLLAYYAAHPSVAWARVALTARRGLVHEYTTVVARRAAQPHGSEGSTG
jgi:2-polyprenyl-3-methyl-5-hydroxy-6-metoxy-1,4-benzoquinol methylase